VNSELTLATLVSVAASVTTVGCMTLWTARLNIGSILLPGFMILADTLVPVLLAEIPETLDLSDVDRVKPAPRVAEDGSSDMRAGDSERVVVISVPDDDPLSLSGNAIEPLAGEDCVEGTMLPNEGDRPGRAEEGARSRPRALVWTTSWT